MEIKNATQGLIQSHLENQANLNNKLSVRDNPELNEILVQKLDF